MKHKRNTKYNTTKDIMLSFNNQKDSLLNDFSGKKEVNTILFIESNKPNEYCQVFLLEYIFTINKGFNNRVLYVRIQNLGSIDNFNNNKRAIDFEIFKKNIDLKTKTKWVEVKKETIYLSSKIFKQSYFKTNFNINFVYQEENTPEWEYKDPDTEIKIKFVYKNDLKNNKIQYSLKNKDIYVPLKEKAEIHELPLEYKNKFVGSLVVVSQFASTLGKIIGGFKNV